MKSLAILLLAAFACEAQVNDNTLRDIQFDQKPGTQVDMTLRFADETGKSAALADCAAGRPVVLALGYYECPMLCTMELNGLVAAMQDLKPQAADRASVIFVSINPAEGANLAAAKKASYMKLYARKEAAGQWHFLTGPPDSIKRLADTVGFRYVYDPASRQFAHPSGLVVLTPEGRISRYLFGVNYAAKDLDNAIKLAAARQSGGMVQQFVYLCFYYSPIHGKYGAAIMTAVRAGGILTMAGLAGTIWAVQRRRKEAV
ncbi:MAG TPA: SCO family protein [Verrucomicrobiae bacterium]|jgi:protein SCO1/2